MYSYQNNYVLFARVNLNSMPLWVFVCYISPVRVIENNLLRSHDFCHYLYYHKNLAPFTMSRNFLNKFFEFSLVGFSFSLLFCGYMQKSFKFHGTRHFVVETIFTAGFCCKIIWNNALYANVQNYTRSVDGFVSYRVRLQALIIVPCIVGHYSLLKLAFCSRKLVLFLCFTAYWQGTIINLIKGFFHVLSIQYHPWNQLPLNDRASWELQLKKFI